MKTNVINEQKGNAQAVLQGLVEAYNAPTTLRDLAEAYNSPNHLLYRKKVAKLNVSDLLKQKLYQKRRADLLFTKNAKIQEEEIEHTEKTISEEEEKIAKNSKELDKYIKRMKKISRVLEELNARISRIKQEMKESESYLGILKDTRTAQERKLDQMRIYTIVHPTATITALDKKKDTNIIVSKFDADQMRFERIADYVDDGENSIEREDILPFVIPSMFESEKDMESAICYVQVAYKYFVNYGRSAFCPLYNHEGIKYILNSIMN
ncbi:MAG: hypothetical protein HFJ45_04080 [Clostridia bacterium]|nr:hypothetical protein [Clostridia bacterium]